ncbi:MAG: hypothetical protein AAF577_08335 [Pseudomonadota bacterium]
MAMGLVGKLFGGLIMGLGAYLGGEHVTTVMDGVRLARSGAETTVRIDGKRVEPRPKSGRASGSVAVSRDGEQVLRVQSLDTLMRRYLFEVSYLGEDGRVEALAPVSYARYQRGRVGDRLSAIAAPGIGYVDLTPRATLSHGGKSIAIGVLMLVVGLAMMLLPEGRGDDRDDDGDHAIDPDEIMRRVQARG